MAVYISWTQLLKRYVELEVEIKETGCYSNIIEHQAFSWGEIRLHKVLVFPWQGNYNNRKDFMFKMDNDLTT